MRLLDLFCGAGGAAMGYSRAGFDIVGIDHVPQPHYPFDFVQADALEYLAEHGHEFDAIHASPPCQAYHSLRAPDRDYPDLVGPTRERLSGSGRPWVIENIPSAPLIEPARLCGSSFGLNVRRHRLFETGGWSLVLVPPCAHYWQTPRFRSLDRRQKRPASVIGVHGSHNYPGEGALRAEAMGIDWMNRYELTQAVPPAYTEFVGAQLMRQLARMETMP